MLIVATTTYQEPIVPVDLSRFFSSCELIVVILSAMIPSAYVINWFQKRRCWWIELQQVRERRMQQMRAQAERLKETASLQYGILHQLPPREALVHSHPHPVPYLPITDPQSIWPKLRTTN